jgi:hypothetical protein
MALGPNLTTVTITGSYVDFEGTPIQGQIRFSISEVLRNGTDDQMVAPSSVVVPLNASGSFSVSIPATNDPDVIPNPFLYTVEESFPNGRTYTISIPYTTSGSLDLADLSPDPTLSESYVAAVDLTSWNTLESNITALDALIDQVADKFPASGQYWYIDSAYSTYTALDTAFATYTALTAATYNISGEDIGTFVTSAQGYASSASSSATTAANNSAGTISPLLLIGG